MTLCLSLAWEPLFCPATSPDQEKLALEGLELGALQKCLGWAEARTGGGMHCEDFFPPLRRGTQSKVAELVGRGS